MSSESVSAEKEIISRCDNATGEVQSGIDTKSETPPPETKV